MRLNIRIAGAGGQGVILSSVMVAKAYGLGELLNIAQTQSYGPEARGGACKAEIVISDGEIDYMKVDTADIFIAYNQAGYDKYAESVSSDAIVIVNSTLVETSDTGLHFHRIPATEMAEKLGEPHVVNMVMVGALTKLLPKLHYDKVVEQMKAHFPSRIVGLNLKAFDAGYQYIQNIVLDRIVYKSKDSYTEPEMRTMVSHSLSSEKRRIAGRLLRRGLTPAEISEIVSVPEEEIAAINPLAIEE